MGDRGETATYEDYSAMLSRRREFNRWEIGEKLQLCCLTDSICLEFNRWEIGEKLQLTVACILSYPSVV